MDIPSYQPPWRNSMVTAPSGRNLNQGSSGSWTRRPSLTLSKPYPPPDSMHDLPPDRNLMEGLEDTPVQILQIPELEAKVPDVEIKDCTFLGSYNWLNRENPTILVPGSPPRWTNRQMPYTVPPDFGVYFCDQNGYRMPNAPLLPLIMAVNQCAEAKDRTPFDWSSADVVSDRNGLRKLMRWVDGNCDRDFRIDLQLAGSDTVLFNRWEKRNREKFNGRTYGFSFEKASTQVAPGCQDSTGHHRIITYDLDGLKLVVRFEVDACMPPPVNHRRRSSAIDELTSAMSSVALAPSLSVAPAAPHLTIVEGGTVVSPSAVIELTTRSQNILKTRGFDWKEAYPQLLLSQTTHHMLAIHNRGRFIAVEKSKLSPTISKEEQPRLKKMRKVLDHIRDIVQAYGTEGRISLVCIQGELRIYRRRSAESCLPEFALQLFESQAASDGTLDIGIAL